MALRRTVPSMQQASNPPIGSQRNNIKKELEPVTITKTEPTPQAPIGSENANKKTITPDSTHSSAIPPDNIPVADTTTHRVKDSGLSTADLSGVIQNLADHIADPAIDGHAPGLGDHTHETPGAEGGLIDHGDALVPASLQDDDHDNVYPRVYGRDGSITTYANLIATYPPAVGYRRCFAIITGPANARDRVYICLKSDSETYNWVEWVNGGVV